MSKTLIALDFDGVVCESGRELALSAWKAARELWPRFKQKGGLPSDDEIKNFLAVRPCLHYGYDGVLLWYLLESMEVETIQQNYETLRVQTLSELSQNVELIHDTLAKTRLSWIEDDLSGWIAEHGFYAGVIETVSEWMHQDELVVAIVTAKEAHLADHLLRAQGLEIPSDLLFGYGSGTKQETLLKLIDIFSPEKIIFVEDRLRTLSKTKETEGLAGVELYLATWGYVEPSLETPEYVTSIELSGFSGILG